MSQPVGPGISARRVVIVGNSSTALLVVDKDNSRVLNVDSSTKEADLTGTLVIKNPDDEQEQLVLGYSGGILTQSTSNQQLGSQGGTTTANAVQERPTVVVHISADETTFTDITSQFADPDELVQPFAAAGETLAFGFDNTAISNLAWTPAPVIGTAEVYVGIGNNLAVLGQQAFSVKDSSGTNVPSPFFAIFNPALDNFLSPVILGTSFSGGSGGTLDTFEATSWVLVRLVSFTGSIAALKISRVIGLGSGTLFAGPNRARIGYRVSPKFTEMTPIAGTGGTTPIWFGPISDSFAGNTLTNPGEYLSFRIMAPSDLDSSETIGVVAMVSNLAGPSGAANFSYEVGLYYKGSTVKAASAPADPDQYVYSGNTGTPNLDPNSVTEINMNLLTFPANYLAQDIVKLYEVVIRIELISSAFPVVFSGASLSYWASSQ